MTDYPTLADVEPWLLTTIGTCEELQARGARVDTQPATYAEPDPLPEVARPAKRNHNKRLDALPRLYASRFVGVTEHRGQWLVQWRVGDGHKSRVFPMTPDGEEAAARTRADALGLGYLETRPLHQVRGTPEAAQALEARGQGRKAISGRRIG